MKYFFKKSPALLLSALMGMVFFSAGLYRFIFPDQAWQEMVDLELPKLLSFPIAILEIFAGIFLIINRQLKKTLVALIIFLSLALFWAIFIDGKKLLLSIGELFVFDLNPTDVFMHLVFLMILISLFLTIKNNNSNK